MSLMIKASLQSHQTPLTKPVILPDRTWELLLYRCLDRLVTLCYCATVKPFETPHHTIKLTNQLRKN